MTEEFYFSEDFQDLILACMIRHPAKFVAIGAVVRPEYFWGVLSTATCKALQDYHTKFRTYPTFEALSQFIFDQFKRDDQERAKECFEYVKKLNKLETKRDLAYVVEKTVFFARERALINAIRDSSIMVKEGKWPDGGFAPMFDKALRIGRDLTELGYSYYDDMEAVIDKISAKEYGITTGYTHLDKIWYNGWGPGWLVTPLAPPKSFKTTFCINLAMRMIHTVRKIPCLYYACEITSELMLARAYTQSTGQTLKKLYAEPGKFKEQARRIMDQQFSEAPLIAKFFPAKTATIADIRAHALATIEAYSNLPTPFIPKVIFIDHAETVRPSARSSKEKQSDWRAQADIYTDARALADELKCVMVLPDRATKDAVGRATPNMTHFQGSFEKAGIVDVAIGLCQTDDERMTNDIRYFVFVNRHGEPYQYFKGKVDPQRMDMSIDEPIAYKPEEPDDKPQGNRKRRGRTPPKELGEE